jgi:hypothetical protein
MADEIAASQGTATITSVRWYQSHKPFQFAQAVTAEHRIRNQGEGVG